MIRSIGTIDVYVFAFRYVLTSRHAVSDPPLVSCVGFGLAVHLNVLRSSYSYGKLLTSAFRFCRVAIEPSTQRC